MKNFINIFILTSIVLCMPCYSIQTCPSEVPNEWPNSRYNIKIIAGDNVVIDNLTNLMWKQCTEGFTGSDCSTGSSATFNWQQALEVSDASTFAGFNDWRLPNIKELQSLIAQNCYSPSINISAFPNNSNSWYWSSSTRDGTTWTINFSFGRITFENSSLTFRVRMVRSVN